MRLRFCLLSISALASCTVHPIVHHQDGTSVWLGMSVLTTESGTDIRYSHQGTALESKRASSNASSLDIVSAFLKGLLTW